MTVRRLIACTLLPCYLVACTSWKIQDVSPEDALADAQPDKVRVTLADGSQVVLEQPVVSRDTLTGLRAGQQVSIPLASVSELELRKGDTVKTIALTTGIVLGVAALAIGVVLLIAASRMT